MLRCSSLSVFAVHEIIPQVFVITMSSHWRLVIYCNIYYVNECIERPSVFVIVWKQSQCKSVRGLCEAMSCLLLDHISFVCWIDWYRSSVPYHWAWVEYKLKKTRKFLVTVESHIAPKDAWSNLLYWHIPFSAANTWVHFRDTMWKKCGSRTREVHGSWMCLSFNRLNTKYRPMFVCMSLC